HHHNHRPTEKAAVVVGRQFDVGGVQRTALRGPAQSGDAGGVNAGPELAKLTTIFAASTSSRRRRLAPKQPHTMLRSATTGLRRVLPFLGTLWDGRNPPFCDVPARVPSVGF